MIKKYYNIAKNILFPINRSITGSGTLKTLRIIKSQFSSLSIKNFKSGNNVYDWHIPQEWNVTEAYVKDKNNKKIIDFKQNNLHLIGYSIAAKKILKKKEFLKYIHTIKEKPKAIPYLTSYYKKKWGFCISYNQLINIKNKYSNNDKFYIVIKSNFKKNGKLNYGELVLKGKSKKEILISTYICHPSMANNELSGPIVSMALINYFKKQKLKKTIRFIFIPETIGSIAYIYNNLDHLKKYVIGGYNLSCIGDDRQHSCMLSKYKNSPSDEALIEAYDKLKIKKYKIYSFLKRGSDERQYNSPGVDLKISSIFRTKYGEYPEYHTSLDNFKLVTVKGITGGFMVAKKAISILQEKEFPKYNIICEPKMIHRVDDRVYKNKNFNKFLRKILNFLQYADNTNSLEKISQLISLSLPEVKKLNNYLKKKKNYN